MKKTFILMTLICLAVGVGLVLYFTTGLPVGKPARPEEKVRFFTDKVTTNEKWEEPVSLRTFREAAQRENREMTDLEKETDRLQALMEELTL
mgnify:CR=1 FL=1